MGKRGAIKKDRAIGQSMIKVYLFRVKHWRARFFAGQGFCLECIPHFQAIRELGAGLDHFGVDDNLEISVG
jgi:hypothetical protein